MAIVNSRITPATIPAPYGSDMGGILVSGETIFDNRYHNIAASALGPAPLFLGARVMTGDGRIYRYVKANAAIALGNVVMPDSTALKTYAAETAVAYTASEFKLTFPNVAAATNGALVGAVIYRQTPNGEGANQDARIVVANEGTSVWLDRALSETPGATDDFVVFSPFAVILTTASTEQSIGVASVGAITSGNYGWVQSHGICEAVQVSGAIGAGDTLIGAAAGRAAPGGAQTASTRVLGTSFLVSATTAGDLMPCFLTIE